MKRVIRDVEDWRELKVLDPQSGFFADHLQSLQLLRDRVGRDIPIITTIFSPLAQCKNLAGAERLQEHINAAPSDVELGLDIVTNSTIAFIEALRDINIDGIFYAIQHASYQYFDASSYQRFGEVNDWKILEAAQAFWLNVLHLHGEALLFDIPAGYPVQVLNWHDRETWPDLVEGKRLFQGAVCGGVKRETISFADPGDVEAEAHQALHSLEGGRGLILGTGCVIPIITPWANIRALRRAVDFA
jgi:uroporphyrinogen decarboxylase